MVDIPDDIPEAKRESSLLSKPNQASKSPKGTSQFSFWWVGLAAIALASGSLSAWFLQEMNIVAAIPSSPLSARAALRDSFSNTNLPPFSTRKSLLGHRQYEEAPPESLVSIVADGSIKLRDPAARSFMDMVTAAQADNVIILPISGFRSVEQQQYLFFGIRRESGQRVDERAEVSAPPGYSEHHTGYAIDVIDGTRLDIGLVEEFETTEAFRWLQANAVYYDFELSFEKDNDQGVVYEPWHWRFVGDPHSLETFYGTLSPGRAPTSAPNSTPNSSTDATSPAG